jgi:hypothetical protein
MARRGASRRVQVARQLVRAGDGQAGLGADQVAQRRFVRRVAHAEMAGHREGRHLGRILPHRGARRLQIERALLVAAGAVSARDEGDRVAAQGPAQAGPLQGLGAGADQQQADRAAVTFDEGIGRQGGRKRDQGDPGRVVGQHCVQGALHAQRQVVLCRQRLGRAEHAGRRIEQNGVGVGAAGVDAQECRQGRP